MVYAVIDTNIFVSALITHNSNASTARVLESLFLHRIIPLYNDDIIKEYDEVLHRAKFKLSDDQICTVIGISPLQRPHYFTSSYTYLFSKKVILLSFLG